MSDNLSPRTLFKREKTARVSFADQDAIETVINYYIDDSPSSAASSSSHSSRSKTACQPAVVDQTKLIDVKSHPFDQLNYDRSSEEKRRKKEAEDARLKEIETKARIKSAQSKKRKQSIENEKHKIEEDMLRRRFLQEREKLFEFDSVKPVKSNETTNNKLPDVNLTNNLKFKQPNLINDSTNNSSASHNNTVSKTIYLPVLRREQSTLMFNKQTETANSSPRFLNERDRIKAEEGIKLKCAIENLTNGKQNSGGSNKENKLTHSNSGTRKTKTKEELEFLENKKIFEENAKKVAEIKAQKQKILEVKKQSEYKIDHLKDRKEIKIRRIEEEEEKVREVEEQKRRADEKQRRKEDKKSKKAAEARALKIAEEVARKRAEEERRLLELEQNQRAARLQQEKMLLLL